MNTKVEVTERGSTIFLRAAVIAMCLGVLALGIVTVVAVYSNWADEFPSLAWLRLPVVAGLIVTACTFLTASYQAFRLLHYIDKHATFSEESVHAIRMVEYCGYLIGFIYAAGLPVAYQVAQHTDAPGLMMIGLAFVGVPLSVAVLAGIIRRLIQSAMVIKSENELTV